MHLVVVSPPPGERVDDDDGRVIERSCAKARGGRSHLQRAGPVRHRAVELDAADAAFLELERAASAQQPCGQFAEVRLVADERDPLGALRVLRDRFENLRLPAAGRERLELLEARLAADAGDEELRRVRGAHERARQHDIELHLEGLQPLDHLLETRDALARQRPLAIVGIVGTALRRDRVTNEIQLDRRQP